MRRIITRSLHFTGGLLLALLLLPSCATVNLHSTPSVQSFQSPQLYYSQKATDSGQPGLRVMTLNVAHGRGTGFHQLLQHPDETRKNLDKIVTLLKDTAPDIIALQEADSTLR